MRKSKKGKKATVSYKDVNQMSDYLKSKKLMKCWHSARGGLLFIQQLFLLSNNP